MNVFYQKKVGINIIEFWKNIFKMSIPMALCVCIALIIKYFMPINSVGFLIIQILIYVLIYAIFVWKWSMNEYERQLILKPIKKLKRV